MAAVMFRRNLKTFLPFTKNQFCVRCLFSRAIRQHNDRLRFCQIQCAQYDLNRKPRFPIRCIHSSTLCQKSNSTPQHSNKQEGLPLNPESLVQHELNSLCDNIKSQLQSISQDLQVLSQYHFDGGGKALRPMIILLTAKACNSHSALNSSITEGQRTVAEIAEMIHVASLVHDDVIDASDTRRGKQSVQRKWGQKKAIITGDFILSRSSQMLARLRHTEVVMVLSQVLEDLVRGEFMQLGSKENESERFNHYLRKTFKKTASLIANSCKAVAMLGDNSDSVVELAYQYGKNTGIAFQLVDDLLDFTSSDHVMGKPTAADLRLGLATAPVLFAAHQHPELDELIMRRFSEEGDVERTRHLVAKSEGVAHTRFLAERHSQEAVRLLTELEPSASRDALKNITQTMLYRSK